MISEPLPPDLLELLPPVRRCRGNRLYLHNGQRLLDLYLDDGHLVLGEAERHSRQFARNAAEKGLTRAYPGQFAQRLRKALRKVWPDFAEFRLFHNEDRARQAWAATGAADLMLARPLASHRPDSECVLLRLPCARPFAPGVLAAGKAATLENLRDDPVPPMQQLAATRALDSLLRLKADGYHEELWQRFATGLEPWFHREGPYLWPVLTQPDQAGRARQYARMFLAALRQGKTLLPPDARSPAIIPADWDRGEISLLRQALELSAQ